MPVETTHSSTQNAGRAQGAESGAIGNPGGSIQDAMETSRDRLASAYATVQERSTEVLEGAEGYIHNRPIQSVIYAASIGAVLGLVAGLMLGGGDREGGGSWHRRWW